MDRILKPLVLDLNAAWQHTGHRSIKKAIISMCDDRIGSGVLGMDIEYGINDLTGEYDFSNPISMIPTRFEDWINLPIRPYDTIVQGAKRAIRAPTVVIAINHHKMPTATPSATKTGVYERDGGVCQYTGKKLTRKEANVDHVIPQDRWEEVKGNAPGMNDWQNLVLCEKNLNFRKSNSLNEEIGLKLIRKPKAPPPMPVSAYIREAKHRDWSIFLTK